LANLVEAGAGLVDSVEVLASTLSATCARTVERVRKWTAGIVESDSIRLLVESVESSSRSRLSEVESIPAKFLRIRFGYYFYKLEGETYDFTCASSG